MKKAKIIVVVLIILVVGIGGLFMTAYLLGDEMPPELPTESVQNHLMVTSNGCCFWVEDLTVSLQGGDDEPMVLFYNDTIYENGIARHEIPDFSGGPAQLVVTFRAFYGDECDFFMPVLEVENICDLRDTGVLLYFQEHDDMYFHVIAGEYRASYKMGNSDNRWALMEIPNEVYNS